MLVSVIIPTYNHRAFVLKTLDSVFAQTFTDFEVIVVNDGSPDDTEAVLRPLVDAGRARYIYQDNQGQSAARNRGIAAASGELIALLDDDDLWPSDKLEWQVNALRENPDAALVYGRVLAVNETGEFFTPLNSIGEPEDWLSFGPGGDVFESFFEKNHIVSPGQALLRRSCLDKLGASPFDPAIKGGCDDWELYLRLSQRFTFVSVDRVALYYRVHGANASKNVVSMYFCNLAVRKKMAAQESDRTLRERWRSEYCRYADWLAWTAMKSFASPELREFGWTRPVALTCLRQVGSFLPSGLVRRIGAKFGASNRYRDRAH